MKEKLVVIPLCVMCPSCGYPLANAELPKGAREMDMGCAPCGLLFHFDMPTVEGVRSMMPVLDKPVAHMRQFADDTTTAPVVPAESPVADVGGA